MAFTFCNLGSGSAGNCTVVQSGRTTVLVDAGFSAREMARRLLAIGIELAAVDAIFLTHEHTDHMSGAAVASRRWRRPLFCRPAMAKRARLQEKGAHVEIMEMRPLDLGDLTVTPFSVPHDAVDTVGFVLEGEGVRATCVSDLGTVTDEVELRLRDSHIVALEANHDVEMTRLGPYPWNLKQRILGDRGHLSNHDAGDLLARVVGPDTTQVVLTHLSETNNAPHLALMEARGGLERSRNSRVALTAASQKTPGAPIRL